MTREWSHPPIGPYHRVPVQVHQADPDAPEVARRLIALIARASQPRPSTWAARPCPAWPGDQLRRLYHDDLDLDNPDRPAS
jgi:hypothetical protein